MRVYQDQDGDLMLLQNQGRQMARRTGLSAAERAAVQEHEAASCAGAADPHTERSEPWRQGTQY